MRSPPEGCSTRGTCTVAERQQHDNATRRDMEQKSAHASRKNTRRTPVAIGYSRQIGKSRTRTDGGHITAQHSKTQHSPAQHDIAGGNDPMARQARDATRHGQRREEKRREETRREEKKKEEKRREEKGRKRKGNDLLTQPRPTATRQTDRQTNRHTNGQECGQSKQTHVLLYDGSQRHVMKTLHTVLRIHTLNNGQPGRGDRWRSRMPWCRSPSDTPPRLPGLPATPPAPGTSWRPPP